MGTSRAPTATPPKIRKDRNISMDKWIYFFGRGELFFEALEKADKVVYDLIIHGVLDIPPFFFREDDRRFGELFQVMADRRLGEINVIVEIYAVQPIILFFDFAEDFQPRWIGKRFGYFLRGFGVHLGHIASIYM
jgi:hypothetical protein